jgi:hypothetical protein
MRIAPRSLELYAVTVRPAAIAMNDLIAHPFLINFIALLSTTLMVHSVKARLSP